MATGVGFAALPVVPVFQGISKDLERQLAGPLAKASKSAGESLEKGVGQGADNAAKAVEKAQYRVRKSTQELEAAESKLTEQKYKSEAANKAVEAAARKREEAESKGTDAIAKAEETLARKRAAAEKAARDVTSAEQGVERAMAESANAAKSLEDRQKALAKAQDESADSAKRSMSTMDRFKASAESVGSGLMRAAEGLKVHATVALGAIGGLAASATAYASEAEQSYGAVESIFADHADTIVAKSKEAATAVGLSGREYRELSSVTGAMLKNMGLPMDEVTAKTQDLVSVAADLSATFGGSTKDAIEAVNALMRGEADPIERYGVSIKKTDVNARLAAEGLDKLEGEALKQAEAQTLLAMLMEQTASAQGQFARETDTAAHKQQVATARMNDAREAIGTALLPVMAELADFAAKVAEKIGEHPRIFMAVAGAVAVLSAGLVGLAVVAPIFTAISAAATAAGTSMWGYVSAQAAAIAPIAAVVVGIGALVAGLTWFFTQTEIGKQAWQSLVDAFSAGWSFLRDNVFTPFMNLVGAVLVPTLQLAWDGIKLAFQAFADLVAFLWANVIKPVWDAMAAVATWLWQNVLVPAFDGIRIAFQALSDAIAWAWNNVIKPAWDALSAAAGWLWNNILVPAFEGIRVAWQAMSDGIRWAWENIIRPAWDAVSAGIHWLWDNAINPVVTWIVDKWNWLGDVFNRVKDFVVDTVFGGLGRGLDTVKGWFQTGVEGIRNLWEGLKEAAAAPVRFVVNTVWNNGILKAWNKIADFLPGIDTVDPVEISFATGGILPGYTPGRDVHDFYSPTAGWLHLSGGEAIMRPEWTRAVGGEKTVARMNALAKAGKLDEDQMAIGLSHGTLGAFANGGVIGAMANIVRAKYPMLQLTSGYRPGDGGMHGAGLASDWSNGGGNTPEQLALAHDIAKTYPGSAELIYDSPGWSGNIKNGQNVGPFGAFYTMAQAGPHHHHVHWAMTTPPTMQFGGGVFEGGSSGGGLGAAVVNWVADRARGIWDRIVSPIKGFIDDKLGDWGDSAFAKIPMGMFTSLRDAAWDFLTGLFGRGGGSDAGSVDVSDITGPVVDQVEAVFARHGFTGQQWEDAKWIIQQESGWNPTATNPSSGAYGLFQFNPMGGNTLGAYLPDRNPDPAVQADAGARYIKDRYGDPTAARRFWEANHWYANGGVLPGYTPGRDVHHFFSPTGGALALSGGEAIMVPEWTRAVGGPAVVARMNAAASGGRTGSVSGAFAAGGVWQARPDEVTRTIADELARIEAHLAKVADPSTYEGVVARGLAGNAKEIAGALGFNGVSTVIGGLLGAENELLEARAAHTERLAKITESESALESARKALSEAKSAEYEDDAARADAVAKATEEVTKAEDELTAAREESVKALDMPVYRLLPQLHDGLLGASRAAADFHPALGGVAANLAQAAAVVGPAGVSVGVAVQTVLTGINLFKTVMGAISDFVSGIINSRGKMFALQAEAMQTQQQWAQTVDNMRESVAGLRVSWVEAQVALRDATWKTRLAQADVVRAQLEGAKTVAEAEAKLEAERKRVARAAARDFNDLSLLYDRYRWTEYKGLQDRLDLAVTVTPEILALEAEVNAAKLTALANQRSASLSALQASWEQQKAALNLQQVQSNLALQTQQLALMQSQFGGFGQAESLQAMNTAKLYEERSKAQSQIGESWWRLSYWITGAGGADAKRIKELDRLIAEREAAGKGAGAPVKGAGAMSFFGYGDSAQNAVKNAGYGAAEQAMAEFQERQQLQQIELQKQQLEQQIEQNKLFVEYQRQIGDLTAEIEALKAGAASAQYTADSYREQNPAVKAALEELARFEAGRASQYSDVAAGRRQVVEITIPQQDTYTREQVESMLNALKKVDSIDARVTMLETPAKPGANQVLQDISRRY